MYYANEDIDKLETMLKIPGGDGYVKAMALSIGEMLVRHNDLYKTFGVYWWAVKEALHKYYPDKSPWFMGEAEDPIMYRRAWHGSLFRTVLAGAYYSDQHNIITSGHDWTDSEGVEHDYTLYDVNAGF
jgi:hypothetical protein